MKSADDLIELEYGPNMVRAGENRLASWTGTSDGHSGGIRNG